MSPHDIEDQRFSLDVAWCPGCRADCTVEIVALAGDPGPVAVCVDCGLGVETWWSPGLLADTRLADTRLADTRLADTRLGGVKAT